MADFRQVLKDPEFGKLAREEQIAVLSSVDPEFGALDPAERSPVLDSVLGVSAPKVDPFTKRTIGENAPIPGVTPQASPNKLPYPLSGQSLPQNYTTNMQAYSSSPERATEGLKGATKLSALGGAAALTGGMSSLAAGSAAYTLADMGIDLASGEMKSPEDYRNEAVFGAVLPAGAAVGYNIAKPAIQKGLGKAAVALYKQAAKYPSSLKMADKTRVALTGLRERILFDQPSLERLGNLNDELTSVADEALVYAQMRGEGVPTRDIKNAFRSVTNRMKNDPVFGKDTAEGLQKKFLAEIDALPAYMAPQEVLNWRRSLNEQLTGHFNQLQKAGMTSVETGLMKSKESVRAAVNAEILTMIPELKSLGQRQKDVIDLLRHSEQAASRISNRDIFGLGSILVAEVFADAMGASNTTKASLGGAAGGLLAWRVVGSPTAKAKIAFLLAKAGKLDSASSSTLELIGLTRKAAKDLSPKMKALPGHYEGSGLQDSRRASGVVKDGEIDRLWAEHVDRNALDVSGKPFGRPEDTVPPAESPLAMGKSGDVLSPLPEIGRGGLAYVPEGKYNYPLGEPGSLLREPAFAGVLPQYAARGVPLRASEYVFQRALPPKGSTKRAIQLIDDFQKKYTVRPQGKR